MKKLFLLLFLSLCVLNVFAGKTDGSFLFDENFLYDDNFVFLLSSEGDISFMHKSFFEDFRKINTNFKVANFIGIENHEQFDFGIVSVKICVLDRDNCKHFIKIKTSKEKNGSFRYSICISKK